MRLPVGFIRLYCLFRSIIALPLMIISRFNYSSLFAKTVHRALKLLSILLLLGAVFRCERGLAQSQRESPHATKEASRSILATTTLVSELCKIVGGTHVTVDSLMKPNTNPHTFRLDFKDVRRLRDADIVVSVGLGFEAQIVETLNSRSQSKPVIFLANSLPPSVSKAAEGGGNDAHFWGDVSLWARAAEYLAAELGNLDYQNHQAYLMRGEKYRRKLMALHHEMSEKLREVRSGRRVLTTPHLAFRYFGAAYGWENIGFWESFLPIYVDEAAKKKRALAVLNEMQKRGTSIFFGETTAPTDLIDALNEAARGHGFSIVSGGALSIDTLGEPDSDNGGYEKMMRRNLETIMRSGKQD